jgi:type IV pilus modification protein PilV
MTSASKKFSARGFSLLEVLIAVVILSVGLLALASLQLSMIRASSATKAQTLAADLAKDKIESLRSFTALTGTNSYLSLGTTSPQTETLNDSGGNQGGVNYTRTTTITRYVYNKISGAFETGGVITNTATDATLIAAKSGTIDYSTGKDFKLIKVSVGWTDPVSGAQSAAMEDIVDSLDPSESASIAKVPTTAGGPRTLEEIITDPALDNMVIPIALGGGVDSAATNPKPTVTYGGGVQETSFNVLTYAGVNGGTATAQQKVETLMEGCTCTLDSPVASTVRGMRPTYWNGLRYVTPVAVDATGAASYSPPGKPDPASSAVQSAHCDICCRDHFDPVGVTGATFSPRLVSKDSNDKVTAAHLHYFDKASGTPATSGTYKEACRLIRVDGFWRVAADMENDYFATLATGDGTTASSYGPDTTSVAGTPAVTGATARYQNFVLDYVGGRFVTPTPTTGTEQSTYNSVGTPVTTAAGAAYVLDNPSVVALDNTMTGTPACTTITGISNSNPAVVTYTSTAPVFTNCAAGTGVTFANGDRVYITGVAGMTTINDGGSSYTVANINTGAHTFQLSGVDTSSTATYPAYVSGGTAEVSHGKWLHARGLYVDYLEKEATDAITAVKANSSCTASSAALSLCTLKLLPFTSINLTEIADWSTGNNTQADVTSNNYSQTLTQTEPVRGETRYITGATTGTTVDISTKSRKYNTSLLDLSYDSISPSDDIRTTDTQSFRIGASVVGRPNSGIFYYSQTGALLTSGLAVNSVVGTQGSTSCDNPAGTAPLKCNVTGESTTIAPVDVEDAGLGIANTMKVQVIKYNYAVAGATAAIPNGTTCTGVGNAAGFTNITYNSATGYGGATTYTPNTCYIYPNPTAVNTTSGGTVTSSYTNPGVQSAAALFSFQTLNASDTVAITFGTATGTAAPVVGCTFSCTQVQSGACKSAAKTTIIAPTATCAP